MSTVAEGYQSGWKDPWGSWTIRRPYGGEHKTKAMTKVKIDAHKYETEAGTLPIEVCQNMWLIKYGNEPIKAVDTVDQDDLMWEIGNRLFWAGLLEHDTQMDTYSCKS